MGNKKIFRYLHENKIAIIFMFLLVWALILSLLSVDNMFSKKIENEHSDPQTPSPQIKMSPTVVLPSPKPGILFPNDPTVQKGYEYLITSSYRKSGEIKIDNGNETDYYERGTMSGYSTFIRYIEKDQKQGDVHQYEVSHIVFPIGLIREKYDVNLRTKEVMPVFASSEKENILNPTLTRVQIPNTNKSLLLPTHFTINNDKTLFFKQSDLSINAFYCFQIKNATTYCQSLNTYLEETQELIAKKYISVGVRTLEWNSSPHEWALDNISYQGKTLRETIAEYKDYQVGPTTTIGNNDFYKIGEGCCGDTSFSYMTKGFADNGTPLLIIFRANGYMESDPKTHVRTNQYLEELLKTMN